MQKNTLISQATNEVKQYQKYVEDLKGWEKSLQEIKNNIYTAEKEVSYIKNEAKSVHDKLCKKREDKIKEIFVTKNEVSNIYRSIYTPVKDRISQLLPVDENISFNVETQNTNAKLSEELLTYISNRHSGMFKGSAEARGIMDRFIKETEFNDVDSVLNFINNVLKVITEDIGASNEKINDKLNFYKKLCDLDYINVVFSLKMNDLSISELSPGGKGLLLLIFYLALSKNDSPLIIDQPEDNLDNQSIFKTLVPCIMQARIKRQVIIVTHNPNIAVACDADQIIYCNMSERFKIEYMSGSIENPTINEHIVNVLEGTMPAFTLRRNKYENIVLS